MPLLKKVPHQCINMKIFKGNSYEKRNLLFFFLTMLFLTGCLGRDQQATASTSEDREDASPVPTDKAGVILTFDDKSVGDWVKLIPVFKKYGACATFCVCKFNELSREEIKNLHELQDLGSEIASHSYSHKNALDFSKKFSIQEYIDKEIRPSLSAMKEEGFDVTSFAYPYGSRSAEIDKSLLQIFSVIRGTTYSSEGQRMAQSDKIYYSTGENHRLIFGMGLDFSYGNTMKEIRTALDRAKKNSEIICLYGHDIKDQGKYARSLKEYEEIIRYAHEIGLTFYRMKDINAN